MTPAKPTAAQNPGSETLEAPEGHEGSQDEAAPETTGEDSSPISSQEGTDSKGGMTIAGKLYAGFGVLVLIIVALVIDSYAGLSGFSRVSATIENQTKALSSAAEFTERVDGLSQSVLRYALVRNEDNEKAVDTGLAALKEQSEIVIANFAKKGDTAAIEQAQNGLAEFDDILTLLLTQLKVDSDTAEVLFGAAGSLRASMATLAETVAGTEAEGAADLATRLNAQVEPVIFGAFRYLTSLEDDKLQAFRAEADKLSDDMAQAKQAFKGLPRRKKKALRFATRDFDEIKNSITQVEGAVSGYRQSLAQFNAAADRLEAFAHEARVIEEHAQQDALKAFSDDADKATQAALLIGGAAVIITILVAGFLARSISRPLKGMTSAMTSLAEGDLDADIPGAERSDEIGHMADAVTVFRDNAREVDQLKRQQEETDRIAQQKRAELLAETARQIETSIGRIAESMASRSGDVRGAAETLSENVRQTSEQSTAVASASEQTAANVETVASAAEELSASVSEIRRQVEHSTTIAERAVKQVKTTNTQVTGLSTSANKIGEAIALINDIAEQTNLLALNATIEAARAGEAGKGFAVVASEVKNLANQTARATDEISGLVQQIQSATEHTVTAMVGVGEVIGEISETSAGIASAVEQQGSATSEIARSVEQAASGTHEVNGSIAHVAEAAKISGGHADDLLSASEQMDRDSADLSRQVAQLADQIRAA